MKFSAPFRKMNERISAIFCRTTISTRTSISTQWIDYSIDWIKRHTSKKSFWFILIPSFPRFYYSLCILLTSHSRNDTLEEVISMLRSEAQAAQSANQMLRFDWRLLSDDAIYSFQCRCHWHQSSSRDSSSDATEWSIAIRRGISSTFPSSVFPSTS